jgi:hypothetical protein
MLCRTLLIGPGPFVDTYTAIVSLNHGLVLARWASGSPVDEKLLWARAKQNMVVLHSTTEIDVDVGS